MFPIRKEKEELGVIFWIKLEHQLMQKHLAKTILNIVPQIENSK